VQLAFFLSANKHPTSYEDVFRHPVSEAAKLGVNVFPTVVYVDSETAIHNVVTTVWPGLEVKACRLRLGQSWWQKMQSLGLSKQYGKKDYEVSQILKQIFGLSLLPPAEVCDNLALEFLSNLPNDKRVEQFCDYLLDNCIDADSNFPLSVWSECTASSMRTIKACELLVFHVQFNALFYIAHRNNFFVSALQKIRNETYVKMRSVTTRRFKKSTTFKKEDIISSKIGQYKVSLISRIEFISTFSYKFLPNTHL
jgi:hypothetical protein